MQGVLIASADAAVRKSLNAIVGVGRTVHECSTVSEVLTLAAAQRMDYLLIDDVFEDGNVIELAERLNLLGYGIEIVPIVVSDDTRYLAPFAEYGVRFGLVKPFNVAQVQGLIARIDELAEASHSHVQQQTNNSRGLEANLHELPVESQRLLQRETDIREISQFFRRLLTRSSERSQLVEAFAEGLQEQFDVDNVVVLLPAQGSPCFRVAYGDVSEEVRRQFFIPFNEPLLTTLLRLGKPISVDDEERLGPQQALIASRYGERLGVRLICTIASRGRPLAVVGLSRIHRYRYSPFLTNLLRLFYTFFAKALENADQHSNLSALENMYHAAFQSLPSGVLAISADGIIRQLNPSAAMAMAMEPEQLLGQPVEKAGSRIAHIVREVLSGGKPRFPQQIIFPRGPTQITVVPFGDGSMNGVVVELVPAVPAVSCDTAETTVPSRDAEEEVANMCHVLAHNFKNAFVPIKTCAELLPERYESQPFRESFFEVVDENIGKIDAWLVQLLRLNELIAAPLERTVFSLHAVLDSAFDKAMAESPQTKVNIHRDYEAEVLVNANREALEQAFMELVRNAVAAVQDVPHPKISLFVRCLGNEAEAGVRDNGPGFEGEARSQAMRPFFTSKLSGLGLGLAVVRKAAEMHGGRLKIDQNEDGGACASVLLPSEQSAPIKVESAEGVAGVLE